MFYIFSTIFLLILSVFFVISAILIYHATQYRLPEKDDLIKPLIIVYVIVSAILLLISIAAFFSIPWDIINF